MKLLSALAGGLAGACAMTLLHETIRRIDKDAPRLDMLGMEAIKKETEAMNMEVPSPDKLFMGALSGDIAGNSLYFSLAGLGKNHTNLKGALIGIAAGIGAIYLPGVIGLNKKHSGKTDKTKALSALYYAVGGLVASEVMTLVDKHLDEHDLNTVYSEPLELSEGF